MDQESFNISTQKVLAESLITNLENQTDYSLLPSDIGLTSGNVNKLVESYNQLVLKRKNLLSGATIQNPIIIQLSNQLSDLRNNILNSVRNYIASLNTSLLKFNDFSNDKSSEISKIPALESDS